MKAVTTRSGKELKDPVVKKKNDEEKKRREEEQKEEAQKPQEVDVLPRRISFSDNSPLYVLSIRYPQRLVKAKLDKKNLDMIVLNSLRDQGAGFKGDTNKIKIITKAEEQDFVLKSKNEVAKDILDFIELKLK